MRNLLYVAISAIIMAGFLSFIDLSGCVSPQSAQTSEDTIIEIETNYAEQIISYNDSVINESSEDIEYDRLRIDTVLYAGGHAFGYSGDVSDWDGWYYDTVPVGDDFMLKYDSVGPSTLHFSLVTRDLTVDLGSESAKNKIKRFLGPIAGFKRFRKEYVTSIDSIIDDDYGELKSWGRFSFVADYADSSKENAAKINQFVCELAGRSGNINVDVSTLTSLYIGYNQNSHSSKEYSGTFNILSLSDFIFAKTVEGWKQVEDVAYLGQMASDLAIRIHIVNQKYVTFSVYDYSREGVGHGMYTETFYTFDMESGDELSNDKLFKPNALEKVKLLLFNVMAKDPSYTKSFDNVKTADEVMALIEGWQTPNPLFEGTEFEESEKKSGVTLPQGALTESGIVFSFQPYEIDCWASGAYHFIVPYARPKSYLTPQAKALIKRHGS